jgi:hypothetical protein
MMLRYLSKNCRRQSKTSSKHLQHAATPTNNSPNYGLQFGSFHTTTLSLILQNLTVPFLVKRASNWISNFRTLEHSIDELEVADRRNADDRWGAALIAKSDKWFDKVSRSSTNAFVDFSATVTRIQKLSSKLRFELLEDHIVTFFTS